MTVEALPAASNTPPPESQPPSRPPKTDPPKDNRPPNKPPAKSAAGALVAADDALATVESVLAARLPAPLTPAQAMLQAKLEFRLRMARRAVAELATVSGREVAVTADGASRPGRHRVGGPPPSGAGFDLPRTPDLPSFEVGTSHRYDALT